MKKFNKSQIKKLQLFWASQEETSDRYWENIHAIETVMRDTLGIPDLEFFVNNEGQICGIGNQWANEKDKYELIQQEELE